jgi:hypothetical protein
VLAIAGDYIVIPAHRGDGADADRFLADVQVTEAADFSEAIGFRRLLFEAPNQQHLVEEINERLAILLKLPRLCGSQAGRFVSPVQSGIDYAGRVGIHPLSAIRCLAAHLEMLRSPNESASSSLACKQCL